MSRSIQIEESKMELMADRLRELRQSYHWTQDELAQRSQLERKSIIRYENAQSVPTGKALLNLTRIFGVSADYLLGLSDDLTPVDDADISDLEREMIAAFRAARNDAQRKALLHALKDLAARM